MPGRITSLFRNLVHKRTVEQALDDEMRSSADLLTEEKIKEGLAYPEARRLALIELGGVEQVKEEVRAVRVGRLLEDLARDVRFAIRTLAKSPGFTAVAVLTLSLGVGANTAIFTIVHDFLFSPRPYPDEAQVVQIYTHDKKHPSIFRPFSYPTYADIREQSAIKALFTGVLAHNSAMVSIGEGETSRRTFVDLVSSNYFRTLEVPIAQGRAFLPEEEVPGSDAPVVIASYAYWKNTGSDPQLVGKTIRVNERAYTVVGIAPEYFSGTMMIFGPELYFPLGDYDLLTNGSAAEVKRTLERRDANVLLIVGRLKPRVTASTAEAALVTVAANLEKALPLEQKDQTFLVRPLPRLDTGPYPADHESSLTVLGLMLCALAAIVLFVACLNLAGVLLARGMARRKEIAIRLSLGGGRWRIIRQLLTEGLVLSLAGGAGGFLIGHFSSQLLAASLNAHMPVAAVLKGGADPAVLLATLAFCALAVLFFALGPALKLTRPDLITNLKEQAGEDPAPRRHRWLPRNPLVVAQVALSLGLVTSAGLFIRGALKAGSVRTGFNADSTILIEADASLGGYDQTRSLQLYRAVCDRLAALPGVEAVSIASTVPFGTYTLNRPVKRAGVKPAPDAHPSTAAEGLAYNVRWSGIGADYFATMGLPLERGRAFTKSEAEIPGAPPVAIIDDVLAKKLWPEGDALGQRIEWAESTAPTAQLGGSGILGMSDGIARRAQDPPSIEIVGIVPATRWEMFQSKVGGQIYVPFAQDYRSSVFFQVRTAPRDRGADAALFNHLRQEARSTAPGVPIFNVKTFRRHFEGNMQLWVVRSGAAMVSLFGSLALLLAVVGVYGVVAYGVARRTREIGIRTALGARPREVLRMILREGLVMTLGGAVPGMLLAFSIGRLFSGVLYQVSATDPVAFTLAPVVLVTTALVACWLPARRAARLDPLVALRNE
jgi:putative ABC transport system permease protein